MTMLLSKQQSAKIIRNKTEDSVIFVTSKVVQVSSVMTLFQHRGLKLSVTVKLFHP